MKIVLGALSLLLVAFGFYNKEMKYPVIYREQRTYSYVNQSLGLSDISRLYIADSTSSGNKIPFFKRKSLQTIKASVRCKLKETFIDNTNNFTSMLFQICDPEVTIESSQGLMNTDSVMEDIKAHPVFVEFFLNGKIKSVKMDSSISLLAMSIVKEILCHFQFTKPERKSDVWYANESGNLGEFTASYHLLEHGPWGNQYEKRKTRYVTDSLRTNYTQNIPDEHSIIDLDATGRMVKQNMTGQIISVSGQDTISVSRSKISIALENIRQISNTEFSGLMDAPNRSAFRTIYTLADNFSDSEISKMTYQHTLGTDNLQSLLDILNATHNATDNNKEVLVTKFRALASLFPGACRTMGTLLVNEPYGSLRFEILGNALSRTESSTSTNVISKLILARKEEENIALNFLPFLATNAIPTDNAVYVTTLLGFGMKSSYTIASTAQLALGGIAHNYESVDPSKFSSITNYLLDKTQNFTDTIQRVLILGNTGSDKILPLIKYYITNPKVSVNVKTYSVGALRFVDNDNINQVFNIALATKDSSINKAVIETLNFRKSFFKNKGH